MSYTHYWRPARTSRDDIAKATEIVRALIKSPVFGQFVNNLPTDRVDYSGFRYSKSDKFVSINGYISKEYDVHLGCEVCNLREGNNNFTGCNTQKKPYDLTVVACLTLWEMAGLIKDIGSDSAVQNDFADHWKEALKCSVKEVNQNWTPDADAQGYERPTEGEVIKAFAKVRASVSDLLLAQYGGEAFAPLQGDVGGQPHRLWF